MVRRRGNNKKKRRRRRRRRGGRGIKRREEDSSHLSRREGIEHFRHEGEDAIRGRIHHRIDIVLLEEETEEEAIKYDRELEDEDENL